MPPRTSFRRTQRVTAAITGEFEGTRLEAIDCPTTFPRVVSTSFGRQESLRQDGARGKSSMNAVD